MTNRTHSFKNFLLNPIPNELWRDSKPIEGTRLGFCDTCGFCHVDPYPSNEYLVEFYSNYEMPTPQANLSETARLLAKKLSRNSSILDMGCGDGAFLLEMKKLGYDRLSGFDQSPGVERAKQMDIGNIYFSSIWEFLDKAEKQGSVDEDAFVMVNVLEHIPEPNILLERMYGIMKEGAVLAVTVPNDFSPLQNAFLKAKGHLPWFVYLPDHLNYFNFASLSQTLKNNGFDEVDRSALYPLELFLLQDLDYIHDPALGPIAHERRVMFEENMKKAGMTDVLDHFYETLAMGGYGRDVMMIARKGS